MANTQAPILFVGTSVFGLTLIFIVGLSTPEAGILAIGSFYVSLLGFLVGLFSLVELFLKKRITKNRFHAHPDTFSYGAIAATAVVAFLIVTKIF